MISYYKVITAVIWLISKLPFPLLYLISDVLAFKLYYIFRYRKKVVFQNLRNSFPNKTEKEIKEIAKKFYRNFADLIIEVVKIRSITKRQVTKRIQFRNYDLIDDLYKKKKSIIVTIGHCGNWEWMTIVLGMISSYRIFGVVKPLNDPVFEKYLRKLRLKFNIDGGLISFKSTFRTMVRQRDDLTINIFAGDQTPTKDEINYRTQFLNQETPVFLGIEKIAKSLDFAVVFFNVQRRKRGFYDVDISLIEENPQATEDNEITEKHVKMLEKIIIENPDNWLWSHRRWKHMRE
ncbi:MAG: lysophospholipid acyltransferase family protein [Bacteroidales bacterium]|nr:lysophospholipid acyltransferase family protein [Bacteroidales bacterium]